MSVPVVEQISSRLKEPLPTESSNGGRVKIQHLSKGENANSSAVHPMRNLEDDNLDYDSNASSSSLEFHKERTAYNQFTKSLSRPMPSKWNDAEKWIINRLNGQPNDSNKKNAFYNQANRMPETNNMVRVATESANHDLKSSITRIVDTKRMDFGQPTSQLALEKFSFIPTTTPSISSQAYGGNMLIDQCTQSKDLVELDQTKSSAEDKTVPVIRSVCMRDMGTEMTPVTSQEPSRTATPVGTTTPLRSPNSSIPSTPRRGAPMSTPAEHVTDDNGKLTSDNGKKELTEQELKQKTRREIVALGVRLGKMNIAAWASKEDQEKKTSSVEAGDLEELEQIEFEQRAAVWEEAEKSKHTARFKREEIKLQAWVNQQKAKLEAEMLRIEGRIEQMKAQGQAKMVKKIAMVRKRAEEKRAAAEGRKGRDAERTAAQAEYIRQTGKMPSSRYMCCAWFS